jgi:dTMP kinase
MANGRGFNYWEAGMDMRFADTLYDNFCAYQSRLIAQFDAMAEEFGFITLDANRPVQDVFHDLSTQIRGLLRAP